MTPLAFGVTSIQPGPAWIANCCPGRQRRRNFSAASTQQSEPPAKPPFPWRSWLWNKQYRGRVEKPVPPPKPCSSACETGTKTWDNTLPPTAVLLDREFTRRFELAPFHLLATEGKVHVDQNHVWHMDVLAKICNPIRSSYWRLRTKSWTSSTRPTRPTEFNGGSISRDEEAKEW